MPSPYGSSLVKNHKDIKLPKNRGKKTTSKSRTATLCNYFLNL